MVRAATGIKVRHPPPGAIAAHAKFAGQLVGLARLAVVPHWLLGSKTIDADNLGLEFELPAGLAPGADEVLDDVVLIVDRDAPTCTEVAERDAVPLPFESQVNAVVYAALRLYALPVAVRAQQLDGPRLQHARSHAMLGVGAGAAVEHHALDAHLADEVSQEQPGGAAAHDGDLRAR